MPAKRAPWVPVILAGGAGSRLWPVSRPSSPKPFFELNGGATLLRRTVARAAALKDVAGMVTVTSRELLSRAVDELAGGGPALRYIAEPVARDTAPAVAVAALEASLVWGEEALLFVMPGDHWIGNVSAFVRDAQAAAALAASGRLVAFGVAPRRAEAGCGWLELGDPIEGTQGHAVTRFVEKPASDVAEEFAAGGRHLWSAGLFCFRAGVLLEAFERHRPALLEAAREAWIGASRREFHGALVADLEEADFAKVPAESLEAAILEEAEGVVAVRARFDWTDIGSWQAVHGALPRDREGNAVSGEAVLLDVKGSLVHSESRIVAAVGVRDLVIVDSPDAVLVADRSRARDVRAVVDRLREAGHGAARAASTVTRPWGTATVVEEGAGFRVNRVVIRSGCAISLQRHASRSEHWVVVSGEARVAREGRDERLGQGESTFVPVGQKHRLSNPGKDDLVIIEVQCGPYLGEDDIERFDEPPARG